MPDAEYGGGLGSGYGGTSRDRDSDNRKMNTQTVQQLQDINNAEAQTDKYGGVVMTDYGPLTDDDGNYVGYGLGPISNRDPGELGTPGVPDFEAYQNQQIEALATNFDLTNPLEKGLYDSIRTKLTNVNPETVTKQQMEAFARQMGTTLSGLQNRYKPEAISAMAAFGLNQSSLANQAKGIIDTFTGADDSIAGVPEDAKYSDIGIAAAKTTLAGMTTKDLVDIGNQIGYGQLAKGLTNIGMQGVLAQQIGSIFTGKPAFSASSGNYTDPVTGLTLQETLNAAFETGVTPDMDTYYTPNALKAQGIINAGVFKTDELGNIQGSLGYNLTNSPLANMIGVNPSYAGAYVDPAVAAQLGFQYSGSTYGMPSDQFGIVSSNLANPYQGYGQYYMSQIGDMVDKQPSGSPLIEQQQREQQQQFEQQRAQEEQERYFGTLDDRQLSIYNRLINQGYGDDYAKLYVEGMN